MRVRANSISRRLGILTTALTVYLECATSLNHRIADRNERVSDYLQRQIASGATPGLQYVVVSADSVLFARAAGAANLAAARALSLGNTMMAYSMTKTFTAAAVLQLVSAGKINLEAPVSEYLPGLPYGNTVLIRHLLAQTSGLPDPLPLRWVHLAEEHRAFSEVRAYEQVIAENPKMRFEAGKKYAYSNISYWILGQLVEKISGEKLDAYMQGHIFAPLGLKTEAIGFTIPRPDNHAAGYLKKWSMMDMLKSFLVDSRYFGEYQSGWLRIQDHYVNGPGFGGLVASAPAIGTFLQDQLRPRSRILSPLAHRLFYTEQTNNAGEKVAMTLGWHARSCTGDPQCVKYYFKEGGGAGYHSEMRIYPDAGIASVVIANNAAYDVKDFLNAADAEFMR